MSKNTDLHTRTTSCEDQCFVEEKNRTMVRQVVGHDRFVGEQAYRQLEELYRALRLYFNCFQASMKLLSKQRNGKKISSHYDAAKTPLQRLLLSGVLPEEKQQELNEVAQALDPIRLLEHVQQMQKALFRFAVDANPFVSSPVVLPMCAFVVQRCMAGVVSIKESSSDPSRGLPALYQEQEKRKRVLGWQRTHKDPFEGEWERIALLFGRLRKRAGITRKDVGASLLRDTFAMQYLQAGGGRFLLRELLGQEESAAVKRSLRRSEEGMEGQKQKKLNHLL